jgi:hypothetical protein
VTVPNETYPFELPRLTFAPDALEPYIDARTMSIHHGEHHRFHVKRLNAVRLRLGVPGCGHRKECFGSAGAA